MATPQAYPLGYVEDVAEVRTPLGIVFTILPSQWMIPLTTQCRSSGTFTISRLRFISAN
jgi:hypothetical protein